MTAAFWINAVLLGFYVALAVLYGLQRVTWPMALYYVGCLVKDAGVIVLGWWASHG